ncbi:MAG: DUF6873 family GME fold protein [Candidatus Fimenecus sp.]
MNGRFIAEPNLPESDVLTVISANCDKSLEKALSDLSIKIIATAPNPFLDDSVAVHGDILCYHLGNNKFLIDQNQTKIINELTQFNCTVKTVNGISSPYPKDCSLNCADIGDFLICNESITDKTIIANAVETGKTVINVKQGYAKCSVCIADRNTIITDDASIYKSVSSYPEIKALFVEKGSVRLKNCNYGFIGGCTGLIGNKKLFFNGNLSTHSDYTRIISFLDKNNIKYFDIKNKPLTDIGSILPIIEKDGV